MGALDDRVAWVTGSSRGIGAAIAKLFGRQGARVAVHGRDTTALAAVRSDIEQAGGRAILVANAGGSFTMPGPLEETSEEGWHASVNGNLTATFLTLKSVLPGMKERRRGSIITMSSAAARRPHPGSPIPYAAAKAGLQLLTQDLAAQLGPYAIRV